MKQAFTYGALLALALFFNACQNKQQASEATSPADTTEIINNQTGADSEVAASDWLNKLVGPPEGTFRGINLGDGVATVKAKESAEPFEEDAKHVGYTIEYENLESFDVQYFLDKSKKVERIEVDIYLNNRQSVEDHKKELAAYFTRRFGSPTQQGWNVAGNRQVTLTDVSKGKDFGLKLVFGPSARA
ncbi:hypothetical protein ACFQ4C_23735 [Larkinella insperata]|uniref:Lipoprotein n=1 Tax=Larkinella insperata TaxID=332158 RepID=A0ABW3QEF1_9BACT|nr:hypothetical protein [Larkinella insperata]